MTLSLPDPTSSTTSMVKVVAIVLAVLAIFGLVGYLAYTKSQLERKITDDARVISSFQNANESWKAAAESANAKLKAAQAAADQRAIEAQKAIDAAKAQAKVYLTTATNILAVKPKGDDCEATKALLDNFYKGGRK